MSLSAYAKRQMLKMETHAKFPYLIEITHYTSKTDTVGTIYRYANSDEDITFEGNVYQASCFSIKKPERKPESISDASITISAIDQQWIYKIRQTQKRAKIRFVAVILDPENPNGNIEVIDDIDFDLSKSNWDDSQITWTMEFDTIGDIKVPCEVIDERICPALA